MWYSQYWSNEITLSKKLSKKRYQLWTISATESAHEMCIFPCTKIVVDQNKLATLVNLKNDFAMIKKIYLNDWLLSF